MTVTYLNLLSPADDQAGVGSEVNFKLAAHYRDHRAFVKLSNFHRSPKIIFGEVESRGLWRVIPVDDPQSELVTIGLLLALKGGSFRAFYRWLKRDYGDWFGKGKLPEQKLRIAISVLNFKLRKLG